MDLFVFCFQKKLLFETIVQTGPFWQKDISRPLHECAKGLEKVVKNKMRPLHEYAKVSKKW